MILPLKHEIHTELYKKGETHHLAPDFPKQAEAYRILRGAQINYFLMGGAAGGGKSWMGCKWLIVNCMAYPKTRWFIGREELKRLTDSTLETFFKVAGDYGLTTPDDYKYNGQRNFIRFANGSRVDLLELQLKPSDPMYERFGSIEYTGGWIEEGGEVHFDAYDTLKSRIGRQFNLNYCANCGYFNEVPELSNGGKDMTCQRCGDTNTGIVPKILITCNPKKNWLYTYFYQPKRKGTLPDNMEFLQSLVTDNPKIETRYIDNLNNIKDEAKKQRLRYGNWDYDDDPSALIDYDSIQDFFTNQHVPLDFNKYMTADIAMQGSDRFVIGIWAGWVLTDIYIIDRSDGKKVLEKIEEMSRKHAVPRSHIAFDNDGLGSYLSGFLKGAHAFVNNAQPVYQNKREQDKYRNLKSQCYFHFAKMVTEKKTWFRASLSPSDKEKLETEMAWIKNRSIDTDNILEVLRKQDVKEAIGRSPDLTDMLMMRSVFDLKRMSKGIRTK